MNDDPPRSAPPPADVQTLATLAPVARQSVVDAVADRLRGEILAGRLRPGTRLPSERELSLALGVNRLTLRASLARLEALGLITTRHGAGTVVSSWRERAGLEMLGTLVRGLKVADPAWHDLVRSALELRRILASEGVALAAERHTEEDLDAIATCVQVLREHADDPIAFARADLAFMRAVCRAGRNLGLELFLNTFARWPDEHPQLVAILYDDTQASVKLYDPVLDVIRSRNGDAARTAVRRALEALDIAWARRHPPPVPEIAQPANETDQPSVSKGRAGGEAGPHLNRRGLHVGARKAGKGNSEGGTDR
jgi:GntR family transcriptional repressor for pyruvate dehydrogenase complex